MGVDRTRMTFGHLKSSWDDGWHVADRGSASSEATMVTKDRRIARLWAAARAWTGKLLNDVIRGIVVQVILAWLRN